MLKNKKTVLKGIIASSGDVVGEAIVITKDIAPSDVKGKVIVIKKSEVRWTPLLFFAAGVVCEIGGMHTHIAIVAREVGIPMITAVKDSKRKIKNGDKIKIDVEKSAVLFLDEADEHGY